MKRQPCWRQLKKLAKLNARQNRLMDQINKREDVDAHDLCLELAELITGCVERNNRLYRDGILLGKDEGEYYCWQYQGYSEDSYYGFVYFKTDVPGEFVEIPFDI